MFLQDFNRDNVDDVTDNDDVVEVEDDVQENILFFCRRMDLSLLTLNPKKGF